MKPLILLTLIIITLSVIPTAGADSDTYTYIYTWIDAEGIRHYSNHPSPTGATVFIKTKTADVDIGEREINPLKQNFPEDRPVTQNKHERLQDNEYSPDLESKLAQQLEITQKQLKRLEKKLRETNTRLENESEPESGSEKISATVHNPKEITDYQDNHSRGYIIKSYVHKWPTHRWPDDRKFQFRRHGSGPDLYGYKNKYTQRPSKHRIRTHYNSLDRYSKYKHKGNIKKPSRVKRMSHRSRSWGVFSTRSQLRKSRSAASGSTTYGTYK